jgi:tRNA(Ile2) C34 agmatinyltransferase TiaS
MFTPDNPTYVAFLLTMYDEMVKKAIVAIYNRQTMDEKRNECTTHKNGRGFRANHAHVGSRLAKLIISGKQLTRQEMWTAREITLHYVKQLAEIAAEKVFRLQNNHVQIPDKPEEVIKLYVLQGI